MTYIVFLCILMSGLNLHVMNLSCAELVACDGVSLLAQLAWLVSKDGMVCEQEEVWSIEAVLPRLELHSCKFCDYGCCSGLFQSLFLPSQLLVPS